MADSSSRQANGRPVSTIALRFSAALDDAFLLKPELDDLSQSIAQKQQSVSSQKSELEELEARLRQMEARLQDRRQASSSSSSTSPAAPPSGSSTNDHRRSSAKDPRLRSRLEGAFDPPDNNTNNILKGDGERHLQHHGIRPNSSTKSHSTADSYPDNDPNSIPLPQSPSPGHSETPAVRPKSSQARQENIPPPPRLGSRNHDLKTKSSTEKENWTRNGTGTGTGNATPTSMDSSWVRV